MREASQDLKIVRVKRATLRGTGNRLGVAALFEENLGHVKMRRARRLDPAARHSAYSLHGFVEPAQFDERDAEFVVQSGEFGFSRTRLADIRRRASSGRPRCIEQVGDVVVRLDRFGSICSGVAIFGHRLGDSPLLFERDAEIDVARRRCLRVTARRGGRAFRRRARSAIDFP